MQLWGLSFTFKEALHFFGFPVVVSQGVPKKPEGTFKDSDAAITGVQSAAADH